MGKEKKPAAPDLAKALEDALAARREPRPRNGRIYASDVGISVPWQDGGKCHRAYWEEHRGAEKKATSVGSALMCQLRARLEGSGETRAFVLSFLVLLALCLVLSEVAWQLTQSFDYLYLIDDSHAGFVLRSFAVGPMGKSMTT